MIDLTWSEQVSCHPIIAEEIGHICRKNLRRFKTAQRIYMVNTDDLYQQFTDKVHYDAQGFQRFVEAVALARGVTFVGLEVGNSIIWSTSVNAIFLYWRGDTDSTENSVRVRL